MTLWAGRVGTALDRAVWGFLKADDSALLRYDAQATRLHARRLQYAGILSSDELHTIEERLAAISAEDIVEEDEDVHTAIERLLGGTGRKLQAGRSRNDQVAAALRLLVGAACDEAATAIERLAHTALDRAEEEAETPMPGYTHLQRAQPVTLGHHLLAWVEMLERDLARFAFAAGQAQVSPLGAGALAGSTLALPQPADAVRNSLDAVSDRDFALDYLYACAVLFTHLSRIGEEICLWVSAEFGFARLPESVATGSSMMPQKLNPDVAELARGKAGTALGRLAGFLATVKSLPLSYNRDLQEGTQLLVGARADVAGALAALEVLLRSIEFDQERLSAACEDPLLYATDAAEELVETGMAFRDAHEHVAAQVREGTFLPPARQRRRASPGPGDVAQAVEAARSRLDARPPA